MWLPRAPLCPHIVRGVHRHTDETLSLSDQELDLYPAVADHFLCLCHGRVVYVLKHAQAFLCIAANYAEPRNIRSLPLPCQVSRR